MPDLTLKQQKWVDAYLGDAAGNATEAARIAGYSGSDSVLRVTGHDNLTNPNISRIIKKLRRENLMSAEECLSRLSDQGRGIGAYVDADTASIDLKKMKKAGKLHLIKSIKHTKEGKTIEMYDAQSALQLIARHHQLLIDKSEIEVTETMTPEERKKRVAELIAVAMERSGKK